MESLRFFASRKLFMTCVNVPVSSHKNSQKNLVTVAYLKLQPQPLYWEEGHCNLFDDLIFWARNEKCNVQLAIQLQTEVVDLEQETDTDGFMGIHIEHNPNTGFLIMTQKGPIK